MMNKNNIVHHNNYNDNVNNCPSFSSSLLEEIYRSFDTDKDGVHAISRRPKTARMTGLGSTSGFYDDFPVSRERRVLEHWIGMEKKKEKEKEKEKAVMLRRNSMPEEERFRRPVHSSSSTSSSDSSSGIGGFSSSDTDSLYGAPPTRSAKIPSLKPIRTAANSLEFGRKSYSDDKKKSKKDSKLQHALKMYADLKKQPISPGVKITRILSSLFHSGNSKKSKIEPSISRTIPGPMKSASVPSSASSYSRSCLSKTPSSAGKFERRSVRFCPVSIIVDETGEKAVPVYNDVVSRMDDEKKTRVEEMAKELLKNYRSNNQIRKELKVNVISGESNKVDYSGNNNVNMGFQDEDEDEDEDEESCCSSDLFELDNILEIGADERYRQELPVYETTHIRTNRAIGNMPIAN